MCLAWLLGPGRRMALLATQRIVDTIKRNLAARRLLSFPHLLVLFWIVILLWGERWVFDSKVERCEWSSWEKWPADATPHHLIFVADPQITDPHSYPGRPWPLSSLTVLITDNYLRRGYGALHRHLRPDSLFFLGDLFDGGREWKTREGTTFVDPKWGVVDRTDEEKSWVSTWHHKYGEDYWVKEYQRFSDIYFRGFNDEGDTPGPYQRGRKLVAGLPGNHDIGFGAQVQVPVRDRFEAYFGDSNRVDVVGNHTIVSVDTVSLSADTSAYKSGHDLSPIFGPVNEFLDQVRETKRKAVQEELEVWYGVDRHLKMRHRVEDIDTADRTRHPHDPGPGAPELPTILLTHVPLYRDEGTPCGPKREHWPPSKASLLKDGTVNPSAKDERNAIPVLAGYQYQNVLNEEDSVKLVDKVGGVVHVFSGDDHDYCEVVHSASKKGVREITVKSISMTMGVPTPGFLMVSMWHPIGADGKPLPDAPAQTLQTHLCLLPNQVHTYMRYVMFIVVTLVLLAVRAFLVPVLRPTPFALEPIRGSLPVYKDKVEEPQGYIRSTGATSGLVNGGSARWKARGPRITLDNHFYDPRGGKAWRAGRVPSSEVGMLARELWTTAWRVAWMVVCVWFYLARNE